MPAELPGLTQRHQLHWDKRVFVRVGSTEQKELLESTEGWRGQAPWGEGLLRKEAWSTGLLSLRCRSQRGRPRRMTLGMLLGLTPGHVAAALSKTKLLPGETGALKLCASHQRQPSTSPKRGTSSCAQDGSSGGAQVRRAWPSMTQPSARTAAPPPSERRLSPKFRGQQCHFPDAHSSPASSRQLPAIELEGTD